jgi:hypothetical protein
MGVGLTVVGVVCVIGGIALMFAAVKVVGIVLVVLGLLALLFTRFGGSGWGAGV